MKYLPFQLLVCFRFNIRTLDFYQIDRRTILRIFWGDYLQLTEANRHPLWSAWHICATWGRCYVTPPTPRWLDRIIECLSCDWVSLLTTGVSKRQSVRGLGVGSRGPPCYTTGGQQARCRLLKHLLITARCIQPSTFDEWTQPPYDPANAVLTSSQLS